MYKRALERCKKTHGPNHPEIEKMGRNVRALIGKEKIWGAEPSSTLDTVNNLGLLDSDQGSRGRGDVYASARRFTEDIWC